MAIDGVNGRTAYIGSAIVNLRNQLNDLTTQLASGKVSTTYAGQGTDRGFALSLRAQVASIDAFSDTATNVNTRLSVANLALQGVSDISKSTKSAAASSTIVLNNNGQTSGQVTAQASFANAVSLLNSQSGDRYLFSGRATDQPATVTADVMLDGNGAQAGLKQLIDERRQADQGVGNMGRLAVSSPPLTTTVTKLAEDGSAFGFKLGAITSSLTGATVTQAAGVPPSATVDLGAVNPNDGDKISFNLNLPDGTSEQITLTATTTSPEPAGSFAIGVNTTATTANLQAALTTAVQKVGDTRWWRPPRLPHPTISSIRRHRSPEAPSTTRRRRLRRSPATRCCLAQRQRIRSPRALRPATPSPSTARRSPSSRRALPAISSTLPTACRPCLPRSTSITGSEESLDGRQQWRHRGCMAADGADLSVTSSNTAAFAALGFGASVSANPAPLRVGGPPFNTASFADIWHASQHRVLVHRRKRRRLGARHCGRALSTNRSPCNTARAPMKRRCATSCRTSRFMPPSPATHQIRTRARRSMHCSSASRPISRRSPDSSRSRTCRRNSPARRPPSRRRPTDKPSSRAWRKPCSTRSRGINQDEVATKNPRAADSAAGLVPDHRDALSDDADQVPADLVMVGAVLAI